MRKVLSLGMLLCAASWLLAQTQPASTSASVSASSSSASNVKSGSVSRTTKAVHYRQGGEGQSAVPGPELEGGAGREGEGVRKSTHGRLGPRGQGVEGGTRDGGQN